MEIQHHDSVVVDVAGISAGLRQASARGRGVAGGEGGARGCHAAALPPPTIHRTPGRGGGAVPGTHLHGGRRPRGKGGGSPPSQVGRPPPLGFPTLGAGGGPRGAPQPTKGWFPSHFSPWGPPGQVSPPGGPPGPFQWSRYNTDNPRNFPGDQNRTSHI